MRITSKMTNNTSLLHMTRNFQNYTKASIKMSTLRQVVDLEDNPLSANLGIRLVNIVSRTEQYNRTIATALGSLNLTDGYLGENKTIMDTIKSLTVGAAQDSTTPEQRAANAVEMNQILQQIVLTGNSMDGERYIFGGQNTTTPPFTIVNGRYVNYAGNDQAINVLVDNQTTMAINATGTDAYGNMVTSIVSRDLNPDVGLATDNSTRLADLNGGSGVPKGKITVYYSAYPDGLEVDLSSCDTLEDVKDAIEKATLDASRNLDTAKNGWLDPANLNWHDLQDRYVKVTINPEHNGISLQEFDLGEPLPEPTVYETRYNLAYTGDPGYAPGGFGIAGGAGETAVYDKLDFVYKNIGGFYDSLRIDEAAGNKVAEALGIKGTANKFDPGSPDPVLDGFLHGRDLNPRLSDRTLLADLEGYNDAVYTFTNGQKPGATVVSETSQDSGNVFNEWNLAGLLQGGNTGPNGELYARAVNRGTETDPEIHIEIYSRPLDSAKASDLVATGIYKAGGGGGTVILEEANSSGLSGTVGVVLPPAVKEATVNLSVDFGQNLQASVHVPAFIEESYPDGAPKDALNIASGWQIRGLDKPPADGYDENHPASTDLDGDVSVNYRFDPATNKFIVELCRPAFNDQPAQLIATASLDLAGKMDAADPTKLAQAASGRIEFIGAEGFEGIAGSVFIELPANTAFGEAGAVMGTGAANPAGITYRLPADSQAGTVVFSGATELVADQAIAATPFVLKADTLFKKGQEFTADITFANGYVLTAGTPLESDVVFPKGYQLETNLLLAGTIIPEGQEIGFAGVGPAAGTVIPRGSYYSAGTGAGTGFPAPGMALSTDYVNPANGATVATDIAPMGYDLRATFATIEDFNRAVEQAGVYVTSQVSEDGKGLEFRSSLAGAWLTVSEDTDSYEQMGDVHQQLTGLDFTGIVKGVNSDQEGNLYTEVIYYPPDPLHPDDKVRLISDNGEIVEVDPGYYVRVYKDKDELGKTYENRDNTLMVAEGFVPAGEWNPAWDPAQPVSPANAPFVTNPPPYTLGNMPNLILEERNGSGITGHVDFDYYGGRDPMVPVATIQPDGTTETVYNYDPYKNTDITVFPGGLRPEGSRHTTIQEWDVYNISPGQTCDYAGTFHGVIAGTGDPAAPDVKLYKDGSHAVMTSRSLTGNIALPANWNVTIGGTGANMVATITDPSGNSRDFPYAVDGRIQLYEVDRYGNFAFDADGWLIPAGAMAVAENNLPAGASDDFVLTTGAARNCGQEREENLFSTINDIIDALHQNDAEKLHDLIGSIQNDIDHILAARGDVGARSQRMELLSERHADDVTRYTATYTSRVGMDDKALAKAVLDFQATQNAYQAALQVSSQIMQLSLLQYL
ncbi:MAG: flagellar hook-associated protein FlgL [Planctomycetota bacterium]|jgi:flagellin-like hook-associated protein FlgL|nr:flagellar hook-associated protein FlgL [Planctomycetota bacterium]